MKSFWPKTGYIDACTTSEGEERELADQQHPWEIIPLEAYEAHMGHSDVRQWQTLNAIMREQMALYALPTVAIWGVASGNGVEHAISGDYKRIYGLDINRQYLKACAGRYPKEKDRLALLCMDLSSTNAKPPNAALIIANLFVEYVGIPCFVRQIKKGRPSGGVLRYPVQRRTSLRIRIASSGRLSCHCPHSQGY